MRRGANGFTRAETAVVLTAAGLVFSRVFGLAVVLPTFRGHYEAAFSVSPLWIGVALGAHGLTMALMQIPVGMLSDRFGRRPVLVAASLVFVLGSVWAALAQDITSLIAARLLQGVGAVSSVAMAAVGETVPASRRTTAMTMVGIPAGVGFFVGMMAGPALAPAVGTPGLFWLTAGIGLLATLPVLKAPLGAVHGEVASEARPALALPVAALALAGFANNFALQSVVFHLPDASWQRLLPPLLLTLLVVGAGGRLVDRRGMTWQAPAAALLATAVAAPLFLQGGAWPYFVGGTLFFSAHGLLSTTLPSQVSRVAGQSGGRGHGMQNIVAYTGTFVGGAVAGALAAHLLIDLALLAGIAIGCAVLLAAALRTPSAHAAAAAAPAPKDS